MLCKHHLKECLEQHSACLLNYTKLNSTRYIRSESYRTPLCLAQTKKITVMQHSVAAARLWNEIPLSIRSKDNLCSFKKHLKNVLFTRHYAYAWRDIGAISAELIIMVSDHGILIVLILYSATSYIWEWCFIKIVNNNNLYMHLPLFY